MEKPYLSFLNLKLLFIATFVSLIGCELQETSYIQPTPIALEAQSVTSASFLASWEPVLGSNIYFIDVSPDADFSSFVSGYQSLEVEGTSVIVTGLSVEEEYYYRIRAKKGNTISDNSNVIIVTTDLLPAPVALPASESKVFEFTANWSIVDEAASYLLEVASDPDFTEILASYNAKEIVTNSTVIEGLDYRETYYYRVMTKRLDKTSSYSNVVEVQPLITENCKLSKILLPSGQQVTLDYDGEGRVSAIHRFYDFDPTVYNDKWAVTYTSDGRVDSIFYTYEDVLYEKYQLTYDNATLASMLILDESNQLLAVRDYLFNENDQIIGYRLYEDLTRVTRLQYQDYELDTFGNVVGILDADGGQLAELKYDDNFNPKILVPFELRQFLGDSFGGFDSRIYHGLNNPIYANGAFYPGYPDYIEEEVFIYDENEKDVVVTRKGFYSLQYEFTGCNF